MASVARDYSPPWRSSTSLEALAAAVQRPHRHRASKHPSHLFTAFRIVLIDRAPPADPAPLH